MPTLHEHSRSVITPNIDKENIEIETAAWIEYYLNKFGSVLHVWCSKKDRKEAWECTIQDGRKFTVEPKGGVPHGVIYVM